VTCIVGIADKSGVYIGGDSAGVGGHYSLSVRADTKVFRNGPFIMGFTSSFRMGQLLAHSFSAPARKQGQDSYAYMVTDFIDAVRACLKAGGYAERHSDAERGGTFLVGYEGRLFKIDCDYQVGEASAGFDACGCGEGIALGALWASVGDDPEPRLRLALEAAERFSAGVRGPFNTVNIANDNEPGRAAA
jgi:hypothetical protein